MIQLATTAPADVIALLGRGAEVHRWLVSVRSRRARRKCHHVQTGAPGSLTKSDTLTNRRSSNLRRACTHHFAETFREKYATSLDEWLERTYVETNVRGQQVGRAIDFLLGHPVVEGLVLFRPV